MKSSLCSDEIQGQALDEIKSVKLQPCEAGFHRKSDFFHRKWISPVEVGVPRSERTRALGVLVDGFDCVILR